MQISLNWLKEYVDLDIPVEELCERLTMLGLEIEKVTEPGKEISGVVIGQILSIDPHPDADNLVVCRTDTGGEAPLQIVCGAKNMKPGDRVPAAVIGATLPGGFAIGKRKMRGIESQGMMCSARELGLGEDHSGLMILPEDAPLGMDAKEYLGLNDVVVEIEVTPNRGDWACMIGVARELAAYYGKELRIPAVALDEKGGQAADVSSVRIEDSDACPRYMARILENVKVGPSPLWMAQRLIAAGQRPISNIVDITNYVLLETGHPLHAFDFDLLAENRIVVRTAAPGEAITTLDGMKRALEPDMLVIADAKNPQAVAGVMGGADSEVGEGTTRILLESAVFKPASVRRTARKLGLVTEAAQHFQRGSDPEMARYAIDRAAALMCALAGATVREGVIDEYPAKPAPRSIALRTARTDAFLGMAVPAPEQRTILERLGCRVEREDADGITVGVPSWRHDLKMETDLIEEIVRFYGYDRVPATIPRVRQSEEVFAPHEKKVSLLRKCLVNRGLSEFYNWTFSSPAAVQRLGLGGYCGEMVLLQNPLSENHAGMRTSLIPGLLTNAETNHKRGNARLAAFEIGPVYLPVAGQDLADEPMRLGLLLSGPAGESHWSAPDRLTDLYDLKGCVEVVAAFFGQECAFSPSQMDLYAAGTAAEVVVAGEKVGIMGQVAGSVARGLDFTTPVFVAELDIQALLDLAPGKPQFQAIPPFPPSLRDLAVVVDTGIPAGTLVESVRKAGGNLLTRVDIFDVYQGAQLPKGKKSIALSLVFQSTEKTLTDQDTQKSMDKILRSLREKHQAELR